MWRVRPRGNRDSDSRAVSQPLWGAKECAEGLVVSDIDGTAGTSAMEEKGYTIDRAAAKPLQGEGHAGIPNGASLRCSLAV